MSWIRLSATVVAALLGVSALSACAEPPPVRMPAASLSSPRTSAPPTVDQAPAPVPLEPAPPAPAPPVDLPPLDTHASSRVWARGRYGPLDDQFGRRRIEWEQFAPQGFTVTPDGRLLVVDTGKQRLVRYAPDGTLEASIRLPKDHFLIPGDVAVTSDGTIAIIDPSHSSGRGTLLLDAAGHKKGELPPNTSGSMGVYAVGNDLYSDHGESSMKLGSSQGAQDGYDTIAGQLAPDGKTVVRYSIDHERNEFSVASSRFNRTYRLPDIASIPHLQSDAAGRVYVVVIYGAALGLVCLDGRTGDPVGMAGLPNTGGVGGTQLRMFNVAPQGGLVYAIALKNEVRFEVFDCHP